MSLTQSFQGRAALTVAPVHLCVCRKGVAPAAAAALAAIELVIAHMVIITGT